MKSLVAMCVVVSASVLFAACPASKPAAARPADAGTKFPLAAFKPFEKLEQVKDDADGGYEGQFQVARFSPVGPPLGADVARVSIDGEQATRDGKPWKPEPSAVPVALDFRGETFLAQTSALLAAIDDAKLKVLVRHPDVPIAYEIELKDELGFQNWLDEAVPGKVRIIQREDGFEIRTNMGKLPGYDPNGPSVPPRGGKMDLRTLQYGLELVKGRFKAAPDICFVPSFGMELNDVIRAMSANFVSDTTAHFATVCLVYPPPVARDAGQP